LNLNAYKKCVPLYSLEYLVGSYYILLPSGHPVLIPCFDLNCQITSFVPSITLILKSMCKITKKRPPMKFLHTAIYIWSYILLYSYYCYEFMNSIIVYYNVFYISFNLQELCVEGRRHNNGICILLP